MQTTLSGLMLYRSDFTRQHLAFHIQQEVCTKTTHTDHLYICVYMYVCVFEKKIITLYSNRKLSTRSKFFLFLFGAYACHHLYYSLLFYFYPLHSFCYLPGPFKHLSLWLLCTMGHYWLYFNREWFVQVFLGILYLHNFKMWLEKKQDWRKTSRMFSVV